MLRNLKSPETYFQAAFRVQSPWSIKNPDGDNPNDEAIKKPACFVFDFAPTRALSQLSDYAIGLSPNEPNPEKAVRELVSFLPVLASNGAVMKQIDAGEILDIAMAGTSGDVAGPQVGVRASGQRRQRHATAHPEQPGGAGGGHAH